MTKTEICKQYRAKHPDMQLRTLAKLIFKKESIYFKDVENVRSVLRYITGKHGDKDRKHIPLQDIEPTKDSTPFGIPMPESDDLKPYILPVGFNNFILAGDFHIPNHRVEPIEAMVKYAQENNIRQLFINGDFLDNTPFTRHFRKPVGKTDVFDYFQMAEDMLMYFKQYFDEIYWLEGNHDFWYTRWLISKAPELFGDPHYDLETRLKLIDKKVRYIKQEYLVKAGHLNIIHGHIVFRGGSGVNAARALYLRTKANTICSHVHVESSHTEPDLNNKMTTTFTTGCMCTLAPEYQPYGGKACHGFAHIKVERNGNFKVRNYRIENGVIY
jgi:predicted phosphodiesterase